MVALHLLHSVDLIYNKRNTVPVFMVFCFLPDLTDLLDFFVWWHIKIRGLCKAKFILLDEQYWYYLNHSVEDKVVHTFPKGTIYRPLRSGRIWHKVSF